MPSQHSIQEEASQAEGIVVPLELAGLWILHQEVQADGRTKVEVIGLPSTRFPGAGPRVLDND